MTLHTGEAGPCVWSLIQHDLDDETLEGFLAYLGRLATDAVPGQLVLDMCFDIPMPTPVQRRRIVGVLESSPKLEYVAGHALVINSTVGRGLLTAINWVVSPPFDEKVFGRPEEAFEWLAQRNPAFDAEQLLRSVRAAHPDFDRLRW